MINMNLKEFENMAIEVIVECAVDMGESTYVIDHEDLKSYFEDSEAFENVDEIMELIPQVDIDKFNDRLIPEVEEELINYQILRAEYSSDF